jgi:5,10-methenyltetrahydrofolate synthetase
LAAAPCLQPSLRGTLRTRLLAERARFATDVALESGAAALARHLRAIVADLDPQCLGLYWPHRGEFNAPAALSDARGCEDGARALPFARRMPAEMHYRLWDGATPTLVDDCGIPASDGAVVVPDVVLVPCVGYTESGFRLGYGGGYFDRWLGAHAHACAIGVAWSWSRLDEAELAPQPHDARLAVIVTEQGVV